MVSRPGEAGEGGEEGEGEGTAEEEGVDAGNVCFTNHQYAGK